MNLFTAAKLLEELFLLFGQFGRRVYNNRHNVCAATTTAQMRHAVIAELEVGTALRPGWDFHGYQAVHRFYFYFGAKCGISHGDVFFAQDQIAFARELFVRLDPDINIQITLVAALDRLAALAQTDGGAIVNASWNLEVDRLRAAVRTFASANRAGFFWHLTAPVASRAN